VSVHGNGSRSPEGSTSVALQTSFATVPSRVGLTVDVVPVEIGSITVSSSDVPSHVPRIETGSQVTGPTVTVPMVIVPTVPVHVPPPLPLEVHQPLPP